MLSIARMGRGAGLLAAAAVVLASGAASAAPGDRVLCLKTDNTRNFVTASSDKKSVKADVTWCWGLEPLTFVDLDGGTLDAGDYVNIRTAYGLYWSATASGALTADRTTPGATERFQVVRLGGGGRVREGDRIALKTSSGKYVSAQGGGGSTVSAGAGAILTWERFGVVDVIDIGVTKLTATRSGSTVNIDLRICHLGLPLSPTRVRIWFARKTAPGCPTTGADIDAAIGHDVVPVNGCLDATLPLDTTGAPPGKYTFWVMTDATCQAGETNEPNNLRSVTFTVP